jgi:hypothetical protein
MRAVGFVVVAIVLPILLIAGSQVAAAQERAQAAILAPARLQTMRECLDQWQQRKMANDVERPGAYQEFMRSCFSSPISATQTSADPNPRDQARARLGKVSVSCKSASSARTLVDAQVRDGNHALFVDPDRVQAMLNYLRTYAKAHCEEEFKAGRITDIGNEVSLRIVVVLPDGQPRTELGTLTASAAGSEPWQITNEIGQAIARQEAQTRNRRTTDTTEH